MELRRLTEAKYLFDFVLLLTFDDGAVKTLDFEPRLHGEVMQPLLDREFFRQFFLDRGTLTWPNDVDFCTDSLYRASTPIEQVYKAWKGAA